MQLQATKNFYEKCISGEGFEQILVDAAEVAKELEISLSFKQEPVWKRIGKRQCDKKKDGTAKENSSDIKQKFKADFYLTVLDVTVESIDQRFVQLQQYTLVSCI